MGQYEEQLCGKSVWHGLFEGVLCYNVDEYGLWSQISWVQIFTLKLKSCASWANYLTFFVSLFVK